MNQRITATCFFLILSFISYMDLHALNFTVPEWIEKTCVFVMKNEKAEGTGFLIGVKERKASFCYFITAKHVMKSALSGTNYLNLRLNLKEKEGVEIVKFPIIVLDNKPWLEHDNPAVDLAAAPLSIFSMIKRYDVKLMVVESEDDKHFANESFIEKYKVRPGDQTFILGLVPYLFIKNSRNLIMTRFGTLSLVGKSELQLPGGTQKAHFLDCPAFGGQSGGPAFVLLERDESGSITLGWRIALLGIVTGFVPSPLRGVKVTLGEQERREQVFPIENTGISKVVPVDYLIEILFSDNQKRWRKTIYDLKMKSSNKPNVGD